MSNPIYMPGEAGNVPAPYLMTVEEAARFLRIESSEPDETLRYYRQKGWLKAVQIGKKVRFTLPDLIECVEKAKEMNPR